MDPNVDGGGTDVRDDRSDPTGCREFGLLYSPANTTGKKI